MTVQELIEILNQVEDKSKEVRLEQPLNTLPALVILEVSNLSKPIIVVKFLHSWNIDSIIVG